MKRFSKIFAMVAAVAGALACTTDVTEDFGVEVGGKTQLTLSLDNTRTQLGEKNGDTYPLTWSENDQISVNGVPSYELNKIDIDEDGTSATFSFGQSVKTPYFIAYPSAEADNQVVFPTVQNYNAEAAINNGVTVMYGYSADGKGIKLSHLSGLLKIGVKGTTSLKEVRISSVDRKPIAGTFNAEYNVEKETLALTPSETASSVITYSFGAGVALSATATNFYVAVPAGAYEELYITLENTAGNTMFKRIQAVKTENNDKTLKAGSVREFPVVEFTAIDANETFIISDNTSFNTFIEAVKAATEEAPVTKDALFVNDVTVSAGWESVDAQYYTGTIDGNGYAIKGLDAPLFNTLGANIKGLHLTGVNMIATTATTSNFGSLANSYYGSSVSNCSTEGTVAITITKDATKFVGGFFGQTLKAVALSNLVNGVDITTGGEFKQLSLGGIAGSTGSSGNAVATTATNLTNKGALKVKDTKFSCSDNSTNNNFGGLFGYSYGTINASNLTNEGSIQITNTTKPTTTEKGKINLGGILGLTGAIVTAEDWHNKGDILLQNIKLNCSYFNIGGITSYNGVANSNYTNLTNDGNVTVSNVELTNTSSYMEVGGVFGTATKTTNLSGNITNTGDVVCRNITYAGSHNPGFGGIIGLSGTGDNKYFVLMNNIVLKNSGNVKVYGGSYASSFGIAGIIGCNRSKIDVKNATNTGNIISATTHAGATAFVGGICGATWKSNISNSKSYCNIAAFTWDGKADSVPTVDSAAKVGILDSAAYDATKTENCQIGGGWYKSATVVTNENGELELDITYDAVTSSNFFKYISASSNPTSAPGDSVCKYWDGK